MEQKNTDSAALKELKDEIVLPQVRPQQSKKEAKQIENKGCGVSNLSTTEAGRRQLHSGWCSPCKLLQPPEELSSQF